MSIVRGKVHFYRVTGCLIPTGRGISIIVNAPSREAVTELASAHRLALSAVELLGYKEAYAGGWYFDGVDTRRRLRFDGSKGTSPSPCKGWPNQLWHQDAVARANIRIALVSADDIPQGDKLKLWVAFIDDCGLAAFTSADSQTWGKWNQLRERVGVPRVDALAIFSESTQSSGKNDLLFSMEQSERQLFKPKNVLLRVLDKILGVLNWFIE